MAIVTISASYGAGGSEIAPRVAARLGIPFVDRAVPASVARGLGISVEEAEAVVQDAPRRMWSVLASLSMAPGYLGMSGTADPLSTERQLIDSIEEQIRGSADAGSCVILGRAAALVLAGRPDALHVRLDGPVRGRVQAAMRQHGIEEAAAARAQKQNDKIRNGYVQHFYHADSADPKFYDLVLDSVRLGWSCCAELIVNAARLRDAPADALESLQGDQIS